MPPTNPAHPAQPDPESARLREHVLRLEESLAFSDRRVDELNEELIAINRRLDDTLRRLAKLEGKVETLANPPEAPEEDLGEEREPT